MSAALGAGLGIAAAAAAARGVAAAALLAAPNKLIGGAVLPDTPHVGAAAPSTRLLLAGAAESSTKLLLAGAAASSTKLLLAVAKPPVAADGL